MTQVTIEQAMQMGIANHHAGRLAEAEQVFRQVLAVNPRHADALVMLGDIAARVGKFDLAVDLVGKAISIAPSIAGYYSDLGGHLQNLGRFDDAIKSCQRAIQLKPDFTEAYNNLGNAWKAKKEFDRAIECYDRAIQLNPNVPTLYYNLAMAWMEKREPERAINCYAKVLSLDPNHVVAMNNLGNVWKSLDCFDHAIECYSTALKIQPLFVLACNNLANAFRDTGQIDRAIEYYRRTLAIDPTYILAHDALLGALQLDSASDAQAILSEAKSWDRQHAQPFKRLIKPHGNDRNRDRRLRIGYVSADFREHPAGRFVLSLLSCHDRKNFQIFCYDHAPNSDAITDKFRAQADVWRSIVDVPDEKAAEIIRQDQIDILVDLAMHTSHSRAIMFARKPAPVQVCFAAYPGTTGMEAIDYRLTDPYLDPPGIHDDEYSEKSIRLPSTFWCDHLREDEVAVNELPAVADGQITFGCLNNVCKFSDATLKLWAKTLAAVRSSRLLLIAMEGSARDRILEKLRRRGIDPDRVGFVKRQTRVKYLQLYQRIDICLDTLPYNGHATTFDALWMGVPVITLAGQTVVGRGGFSLLSNVGLPELVARSPDEFVGIAERLACDFPRLAEIRENLRERMRQSPLMDGKKFAAGVEEAYRAMWRTWCEQRPLL